MSTTGRGHHLIGKVLGSCMLEKLLGYGGTSAVFLGQQQNTGRKVAVKVFLPRASMDAKMQRDFYGRFLREAEAASKLSHTNVMPIYAYGEQDSLPYIIMPYMPGGTLSEYIARTGALSLQEALRFLEQLTSALDYAHMQGCVHCDVKPANILLDSDGRIKLSDFGIARLSRPNTAPENVRSPEALMGTPDYISPEQAMGYPLDGRSDIYSLGITLFFMLTRRLPFKADSTIALALLHLHEPPPSLTAMRADVTPALDAVVHKSLAKEPDQRFQSAGDFYRAFAEVVQTKEAANGKRGWSLSGLEEPKVSIKPVQRSANRTRLFALISVLLVLMVAAGVITSYVFVNSRGFFPQTGNDISPPTPTPTVDSATIDHLTNQDYWPQSTTFFYDPQTKRYHVVNKLKENPTLALYQDHQYGNFHLSIEMTQIKVAPTAPDYYGVVFRCASDQSRYYVLEISAAGRYAFLRYTGKWETIKGGTLPAGSVKAGTSTTLTVEAKENAFSFSINGQSLGEPIVDSSKDLLTSGLIGLYVENQDAEVAFSGLKLGKL